MQKSEQEVRRICAHTQTQHTHTHTNTHDNMRSTRIFLSLSLFFYLFVSYASGRTSYVRVRACVNVCELMHCSWCCCCCCIHIRRFFALNASESNLSEQRKPNKSDTILMMTITFIRPVSHTTKCVRTISQYIYITNLHKCPTICCCKIPM